MSQSISSIAPIAVSSAGGGVNTASYASAVAYADQLDLASSVTFEPKTYRDYSSLSAVAADFSAKSDIYYIASKWFAAVTSQSAFSIYMKDSTVTPVDNLAGFAGQKWRYFQLLKTGDLTKDTIPALASWCDAEVRGLPVFLIDANVVASGTDDLGTLVSNLQSRHVFPNYRSPAVIATSPAEAYAYVGVMATFSKFDPSGTNTAIDTEYQSVSAIGDNLSDTAISILKKKKISFFTKFAASGEETAALPVNTWSTSPNVESVDDVYNIDVLCNALQVASFNYLTTSGRKRALTPGGFNGALNAITNVTKQFYDNGVLGEGNIVNPNTGENMLLPKGYWLNNDPSDVLKLTSSERHQRKYPTVNLTVALARSGRTMPIALNVE